MCFTEYMGYTCGHASVPVKRLCPLTTQLYNNPCCAQNAVRPVLAPTFCPTCARILHGRWVNIIESEHRFMHERGVCGCPAQFPYLQQPRVVSHYVDSGSTSTSSSDGQHQHQQQVQVGDAAHHHHHYQQHSNGHGEAASGQMVAHHQSHLSGSAAPFVPAHDQGRGLSYAGGAQGAAGWLHQSSLSLSSFDASSAFIQVPASYQVASPAGGSAMTTDTGNCSPMDHPGRAKGKGKANKQGHKKAAQRQSAEQQQQQQVSRYHQQQEPRQSSAAAAQNTMQLAPLFEERQDATSKKPTVSVRMPSLYGAEWLADHAPLHEDGRCSCPVRFAKYESPLAAELRELGAEVEAGLSDINTLAEYDAQYLARRASGDTSGPAAGTDETTQGEPRQNPLEPSIPHVTTNPGHPARWACSPDNGNAATSSAHYANHPIDMQTAWYDQAEVPLAGLPIGAGPEGDSHMPSFEQCELYYPKIAGHRRSASH
ncbi:ndufs2, NADH ubiquinone oxidoreductase 49 kd subunit [Hypoxylon texense]